MKCSVIGAGGYWGPNIVRNILKFDNLDIKYLCDLNYSSLSKYKEFDKDKKTDDINKVLKDEEIETVFLTTPIGSHFYLTKKFLEAGKNVAIQKPICQTRDECDELFALAAKKNLILFACHTYVFAESVEYIKQNLNRIGAPQYYHSTRANLGLFSRTDSVLKDLGPHCLSILVYLFGNKNVEYLSADAISHIKDVPANYCDIRIRFKDNFAASIHLNWISGIKRRKILIGGDKKTFVFDDCEPEKKLCLIDCGVNYNEKDLFSYHKGDILYPKLRERESIQNEIENFLFAIKTNTEPKTGYWHCNKVIKLMEGIEKSISEHGRPVAIAL